MAHQNRMNFHVPMPQAYCPTCKDETSHQKTKRGGDEIQLGCDKCGNVNPGAKATNTWSDQGK